MATKLTTFAAALAIFLPNTTFPESASIVESSQRVASFALTIKETSDACALSYSREKQERFISLLLKPPCHFVLDWQRNIKAIPYEDLGPATVVIIVGTPISDNDPAHANLRIRDDCGAQIQGIVIRQNGVSALKQVHDAVRCANNGVDEKEFWFVSHNDKESDPNGTKSSPAR